MMVAKRLNIIKDKISGKCKQIGRDKSEITLIGVSKTKPVSLIHEAFEAGLMNFGENKAQELNKKAQEYSEKVNWHFIGHLQTNKVKYIIDSAEFIHSVDSLKLLKEIEKRALNINKVQKILFEVKTSEEESKFGLESKEDILELIDYCKCSKSLDFQGLMTMAPFTDDESVIRKCFKKVKILKDDIQKEDIGVKHLSMGMSNDYEIAIEEGATMLRVGSSIFGERNYSNA